MGLESYLAARGRVLPLADGDLRSDSERGVVDVDRCNGLRRHEEREGDAARRRGARVASWLGCVVHADRVAPIRPCADDAEITMAAQRDLAIVRSSGAVEHEGRARRFDDDADVIAAVLASGETVVWIPAG